MIRRPRSTLAAWIAMPGSSRAARRRRAAFLLYASVALFVAGVVLPSCTVHASLGSVWADLAVAALTGRSLRPVSKSIVETIALLFASPSLRDRSLGLLLAAFSLGFPAAKYAILAWSLAADRLSRRAETFLEWGYFSMVEVFVIAVLVAASVPILNVRPGVGLLPFFLSVVTAHSCHRAVARAAASPIREVHP